MKRVLNQRGSTTVELSLILPSVILIFLLVINMTIRVYFVKREKITSTCNKIYEESQKIVGFHNEKGVASVFMCIVLSALLVFMNVFYFAATEHRQRDIIQGCAMLEVRSCMANYDRILEKEYELLGINQNDEFKKMCLDRLYTNLRTTLEFPLDDDINLKTAFETMKNLSDEDEIIKQFANGWMESVGDKAVYKIEQLLDKNNLLDISGTIIDKVNINTSNDKTLDSFLEENPEINKTFDNVKTETINIIGEGENKVLGALSGKLSSFANQSTIGNVTRRAMANEQAMTVFSSKCNAKKGRVRGYELEHILTGIRQDKLAYEAVKGEIFAIRMGLNTAYFLSDPGLMAKAASIAAAGAGWTVFGVGVVQAAIIGMWCLAETIIDIQIITNNGKVPLFKNSKTWRTGEYGIVASIGDVIKNEVGESVSGVVSDISANVKDKIKIAKESVDQFAESAVLKLEELLFLPIEELLNKSENIGQEVVKQYLRSSNNKISQMIDSEDNIILKKVKELVISYNEKMVNNLLNIVDEKNSDIRKKIDNEKVNFRKTILSKINDITIQMKNKLENCVSEGEEKLNKTIKDVFGEKESVQVKQVEASFLNWGYEDYIRVLLLSVKDKDFEKRVRDIIEKEMKARTNSEYDLAKVMTAVRIKLNIKNRKSIVEGGFYEKVCFK